LSELGTHDNAPTSPKVSEGIKPSQQKEEQIEKLKAEEELLISMALLMEKIMS
jgi:hypothetical protein